MTEPIKAAEPRVKESRGGLLSKISFVWLVPVFALLISLGVAWQSYSDRGELIEISLVNADGIQAGKTELKFRNVSVGNVERIAFSDDLSHVLAYVRVDKDVAPYIDADAQFWVVRPQVSVRGISGLGTVLSGAYLEGSWDDVIGAPSARFDGLPEAPLVQPGSSGLWVVLRASNGNQLAAGAPILFKGIRVGFIEGPRLTPSGQAVITNGFIEAPYDRYVTSATRFWDTSGFSVSLGSGGVRLDVSSLASLVEGGVTFETLVSGGMPVTSGVEFPLHADEAAARQSLFQDPQSEQFLVSAEFDGAVGGLVAGSEVRFRGIKVGDVASLNMVAIDVDGQKKIRLRASLSLNLGKLGLAHEATQEDAFELLKDYVDQGLRARLTTTSLLSSELIVELVELPSEDPAQLDMEAKPFPLVPSVDANLSDFNATAEGVFQRINALKVEELIAAAIGTLDNISLLVRSDGAQSVLPEMAATLTESRLVLAELREAGAAAKLNSTLTSAESAAEAVEVAALKLPELADNLEKLTIKTEAVLASYGEKSRLINGTLDALRNISEAADALKSLARTLQRNPNSLILGR